MVIDLIDLILLLKCDFHAKTSKWAVIGITRTADVELGEKRIR